ncbi:MAG TPA: condensation domain-containing protein, partial [Pseudonocardiaceae bacterium]|nr:condensation domain-containing protein [Pseudonocardiaceae bacterium]
GEASSAGQTDDGTGEFPATPIVHWLRELGGPIDSFNQSTLTIVPAGLGIDHLTTAVQALLDTHDALRLRLTPDDWSMVVPQAGSVAAEDCVRRVGVAGLSGDALATTIAEHSAKAVDELRPCEGALVRVVWFDAAEQPGRLLVIVHHLAVDGVSWRILLTDLHAAWQSARSGRPVQLDPVPTSLRTWSRALSAAADESERTGELDRWRDTMAEGAGLTDRALDPGRDVHGTAGRLSLTLPPMDTEPLLRALPTAFRAGVNDVLLTGLALAVANWRAKRGVGGHAVLVDLEGHGRADLAGLDTSRTVGWFTSVHPVRLDPASASFDEESLGRALKRVKEQLRAAKDGGVGFGLLRYLNPATSAELAALPQAQLAFNYLGRFGAGTEGAWQSAGESSAPPMHPELPLAHPVELNVVTEDRADGPHLVATWTWAPDVLTEAEVRDLAQAWTEALRALAWYAGRPGVGGLTPSDVPLVSITQTELDRLTDAVPVGEVLPLSPTQEGLLFHAAYDRDSLDPHNIQLVLELDGTLDPMRLRRACELLLTRHDALRAAFVLLSSGEPVQVIADAVRLPWHSVDLREPDEQVRRQRLAELLDADLHEPFDLATAPLMRCTLARLGSHQYSLVITQHHILLDGWSSSIMLRDLAHLYQNFGRTTGLPPTTPYRSYLDWLAGRDTAPARGAWRRALAGIAEPTLLAPRGETAQVRT